MVGLVNATMRISRGMNCHVRGLLCVLFLLPVLLCNAVVAAPVEVEQIRVWPAPDHTRLVLDVSGPIEHTLFALKNPERVVLDIRNALLTKDVPKVSAEDRFVSRIRSGKRDRGDLRIVLELKRGVRPKSFRLRPNEKYGHRLVVDLYEFDVGRESTSVRRPRAPANTPRDIVVAIDPGHGGEDPGAIGSKGTHEKEVVLSIARKLEHAINQEPGMRAVLTRTGDYYVRLRKRLEIARRHQADVFISIHADAFKDRRVGGSSVYVLSGKGASSEAARWIANHENAADLSGGVSLDDKDEQVASVLIDLVQAHTSTASAAVAEQILDELGTVGRVHRDSIERAGFMVLKSPDIPSILVETNFISNPRDERKLLDKTYQLSVAKALLRGIRSYFRRNPPPGTRYAMRSHTITRGDTLMAIASQYGVSLSALRTYNNLSGSLIRVGETLRIPPTTTEG